jgi:uncharacterized protein
MSMNFARQHKGGVLIAVRLQPRSSRNAIVEQIGEELKITVTAPPVDSAANEALLRFLAEVLDCPKSAVQLLRGQTSRHKQVLVAGVSVQAAQQRLTPVKRSG